VRADLATEHNIKTYSDLAQYSSELTFGGEYDFFEREDGYSALSTEYGYDFAKHVDLDIGLKYAAINNKQIDVMNVFTTDAQLSVAAVQLLQDDKSFYQTYFCGTVVRRDTLRKYPELRQALMMMDGLINEAEMAAMNHAVEAGGKDERTVAKDFLQGKGII
jgi:osmoprotectant transport system permease protein